MARTRTAGATSGTADRLKLTAIRGTAAALQFSYALGSDESLTLTAHAVYLPRPRIEIKGPKGVQASFNWQAALAPSPARMCNIVLINNMTGCAEVGLPMRSNLETKCGAVRPAVKVLNWAAIAKLYTIIRSYDT